MTKDQATSGPGISRTKRRVFRALVALLIPLGGTEAVLQAAHFKAGRSAPRSTLSDPGAPVILCLGDSHTYGAGVAERQAYPSRLEALIRSAGYRANVVNLGAPGMNTSELRWRLGDQLERYHPVAVIALAGVNDGWNRRDAGRSDEADGLSTPLWARAWGWMTSRVMVVRAATVVVHRLDWTRPPEETSRDREGRVIIHRRLESWKVESAAVSYDRARRNLIALVSQARAARAMPILMTYVTDPEFTFDAPNRLLREVSERMKVIMADNDRALHDKLYQNDKLDLQARERLFFMDMHPSAEGYELIAANVLRSMQESGVTQYLPQAQEQ